MSNENSDTPHPVGESAALSRRLFLGAAGALASVPILEAGSTLAQEGGASAAASAGLGLRRLGSLEEVSSIGIGVQNMSRTYQTTIPNRQELKELNEAVDAIEIRGARLPDQVLVYSGVEAPQPS